MPDSKDRFFVEKGFIPVLEELSEEMSKDKNSSPPNTHYGKCPNSTCGKDISDPTVESCPECGSKLSKQRETASGNFVDENAHPKCYVKVKCPNCKSTGSVRDELIPDCGRYVSCPKCKTRIFVEKPSSAPPAVITESKNELDSSKPIEEGKKCPNPICLHYNATDAVFCRECGTKLIDDGFPVKESNIDSSLPRTVRTVTPAKFPQIHRSSPRKKSQKLRNTVIAISGLLVGGTIIVFVTLLVNYGMINYNNTPKGAMKVVTPEKNPTIPRPDNKAPISDVTKTDTVHKLIEEGQNRFKSGDYEKALALCNEALNIEPNNAKVYNLVGTIYMKINAPDLAVMNFTKEIQIGVTDNMTYLNRALAYYSLEKYREALSDSDTYIGLEPKSATGYGTRALCYLKFCRFNEAARDYETGCMLGDSTCCTLKDEPVSMGETLYKMKKYYEDGCNEYNKSYDNMFRNDCTNLSDLKSEYPCLFE